METQQRNDQKSSPPTPQHEEAETYQAPSAIYEEIKDDIVSF
jgi:hypothetical protein